MQAPTPNEIKRVQEWLKEQEKKEVIKALEAEYKENTIYSYHGVKINRTLSKEALLAIIANCYDYFHCRKIGPFPIGE